jgi:hypothetical protein
MVRVSVVDERTAPSGLPGVTVVPVRTVFVSTVPVSTVLVRTVLVRSATVPVVLVPCVLVRCVTVPVKAVLVCVGGAVVGAVGAVGAAEGPTHNSQPGQAVAADWPESERSKSQ